MTADEILAFACTVEGQGTEDHQNCTYTTEELRIIVDQVVALPRRARIMEIGVFCGRSASVYLKMQQEQQFQIHLVDNWSWNQQLAAHSFVDLMLKEFGEVPFTLHKMLSSHLATIWRGNIDFLHIDGWHDLPGIEPDCQNWLPWVRRGGVAAFHDSDCEPIKFCLDKYVVSEGWEKLSEGGRTTAWRKP